MKNPTGFIVTVTISFVKNEKSHWIYSNSDYFLPYNGQFVDCFTVRQSGIFYRSVDVDWPFYELADNSPDFLKILQSVDHPALYL